MFYSHLKVLLRKCTWRWKAHLLEWAITFSVGKCDSVWKKKRGKKFYVFHPFTSVSLIINIQMWLRDSYVKEAYAYEFLTRKNSVEKLFKQMQS